MLWAALSLPSLALDAALRQREPPRQPFALVAGPAQQRRLVAVDARARAAGLAPGQRLAEAQAVCGTLLTADHDPARTRAALRLIAAWAYRWSSQVLLDPPRTIELEVGRSLGLFGPWPKLEAGLRAGLARLGFRHRIALAPNPRAAQVLARWRDGACVTAVDDLPHALADLPVVRAGLLDGTAAALAGMGITRLGELLPLPRAALQRRFGAALVDALDALLGRRPCALAAYRPPDRFDARTEFGCEVRRVEGLLFPLRRMLADLAAHLAARDGGVQRFVIRCVHAGTAPTEVPVGLLAPERAAAALFEVAKLRLDRLRLPAPVLELEVHADALPPFTPEATDLLDARAASALPWPQLVERLRARLGDTAVHALAADPDPRPERASLRRDAAPTSPQPCNEAARNPNSRPAWLLQRPIPLRGSAPRILAGPERLETGWWDGGDIRRDYYVVELPTGQRAWAFTAPGERGPFMLHGWFA